MACSIASVMDSRGKEFDPKITTGEFDVILQYSLLQMAVADFDFDRNEMIFIRDLTEQGDFIHYINTIAKTNITWEEFYNSSIIDIRKVLKAFENDMIKLSEEFIAVFSIYDKATEYDYIADLEYNVAHIVMGLTTMDGEVSQEELNAKLLIFKVINAIKEQKK